MLAFGARISRHRRQQGCAGDADLAVGLHDLGNRDRNIEIVSLCGFHQRGQFTGAEAAPPVEHRHGRIGVAPGRRAIGVGHIEIELRPLRSKDAAGQSGAQRQRCESGSGSQFAAKPRARAPDPDMAPDFLKDRV